MQIQKRKEREQYWKEREEIFKIKDYQLRLQKLNENLEERNKKSDQSRNQRRLYNTTLFLDIHFYFICCNKVENLIETLALANKENNEDLYTLWQELRPQFKPYNDARNHLEHIDERIGKQHIPVLGNLSNNDTYIFGEEEFDIGIKSLNFIRNSYEKVLDILTKQFL